MMLKAPSSKENGHKTKSWQNQKKKRGFLTICAMNCEKTSLLAKLGTPGVADGVVVVVEVASVLGVLVAGAAAGLLGLEPAAGEVALL